MFNTCQYSGFENQSLAGSVMFNTFHALPICFYISPHHGKVDKPGRKILGSKCLKHSSSDPVQCSSEISFSWFSVSRDKIVNCHTFDYFSRICLKRKHF